MWLGQVIVKIKAHRMCARARPNHVRSICQPRQQSNKTRIYSRWYGSSTPTHAKAQRCVSTAHQGVRWGQGWRADADGELFRAELTTMVSNAVLRPSSRRVVFRRVLLLLPVTIRCTRRWNEPRDHSSICRLILRTVHVVVLFWFLVSCHVSFCFFFLAGDGGGPIEKGTMPSYEEEQEKAFFNVSPS